MAKQIAYKSRIDLTIIPITSFNTHVLDKNENP